MPLNAEQQRAVDLALNHPATALLVVGGPGSGKTHTLTHTCLGLLHENGTTPADILMLTFTRSAARSMDERLAQLLGGASGISSGTFHSVAHRLLQQLGHRYHIVQQDVLVEAAVRRVFFDREEDSGGAYRHSPQDVAFTVSRMNDVFNGLEGAPKPPPTALQQDILAEYARLKQLEGGLDFSDLLLLLLRHMDELPPFKHVLVDEVQDLNPVQLRLLDGFQRRGAQLVAIGDDAQAIYGFRGSKVDGILDFCTRFAPAQQVVLCRNYRNPPPVVALAQRTIAQIQKRVKRTIVSLGGPGKVATVATPELLTLLLQHRHDSQLVVARTQRQLDAVERRLEAAGVRYHRRCDVSRSTTLAVLTAAACWRADQPQRGRAHWELAVRACNVPVSTPELALMLSGQESTPPQLTALVAATRAAAAAESVEAALRAVAPLGEPAVLQTLLHAALARPDVELLEFVSELALGPVEAAAYPLELMTVHQAKGLEATVVYVVGLEEFPQSRGNHDEEIRVLFVGLTRTKRDLYLSWTGKPSPLLPLADPTSGRRGDNKSTRPG